MKAIGFFRGLGGGDRVLAGYRDCRIRVQGLENLGGFVQGNFSPYKSLQAPETLNPMQPYSLLTPYL